MALLEEGHPAGRYQQVCSDRESVNIFCRQSFRMPASCDTDMDDPAVGTIRMDYEIKMKLDVESICIRR